MYKEREFKGTRHEQIKYLSDTHQELLFEKKLYWLRDKAIIQNGEYYVDVKSENLPVENIAKQVDIYFHFNQIDMNTLKQSYKNTMNLILNAFTEFDYWYETSSNSFNFFKINIIPSLPTHIKLLSTHDSEESIKDKLRMVELEMNSPFNNEARRLYSKQPDNIDIISDYLKDIDFHKSDSEVYDYAHDIALDALMQNKISITDLFINKGIKLKCDEESLPFKNQQSLPF